MIRIRQEERGVVVGDEHVNRPSGFKRHNCTGRPQDVLFFVLEDGKVSGEFEWMYAWTDEEK